MFQSPDWKPKVEGTCQLMCPELETVRRERENLLHPFETVSQKPTHELRKGHKIKLKADKHKTVKKFSRPAAGKEYVKYDSCLFRPTPVLIQTANYLLSSIIMKETDVDWHVIYNFIDDRLRQIRQDIVIQMISNARSCNILHKCIRFYLYVSYRLCDAPLTQFDPHLNNTQIADCMATLIQHYEILSASETESEWKEELESLYFLFHLGSPKAVMRLYDLSKNMRKCGKVRVAIELHRCYWERNYVRFFRLLKTLSFLELCAVHQHIHFFHRLAVQVMSSAYSSKSLRYPAAHLQKLLLFDDIPQVENLCNRYSISVANEQIQYLKGNWCDNTEKKLLTKYNFLRDVERLEVSTPEKIAKFLLGAKMCGDSSPGCLH